ncbi:MAG: radical SAM protein [Terriglobia bacterium]
MLLPTENLATGSDPRNTLAGWMFSPAELSAAIRGQILLNPSIDLSNACNLNCPYCFIEEKNSSRKTRRPDELTVDEIVGVLKDFASVGAMTVNIVGAGEPTTDPCFKEVVAAIAAFNITPVVFTNGIRLANDPESVDFLYRTGATIVLKFNSTCESTQDLVAGRKGYCQVRDRALLSLIERGFAKPTPTRLALDTIAFQGNYPELPDIHRFCRINNIHPLIADYIPTGRTEGGGFVGLSAIVNLPPSQRSSVTHLLQPLTEVQRQTLVARLAAIDESEFGIRRPLWAAYYSGGCCTQSLGLYVDIQGNIWPCVARLKTIGRRSVSGCLGNVRNGHRPSHIWRSDSYMVETRTSFTGGCAYKQAPWSSSVTAVGPTSAAG